MADIPAADLASAAAPAPDPVAAAFDALSRALRAAALDADDEAEANAATAYRAHIRRVADRWVAGEPSPVRSGKREAV